jgi:hypothetical protein
VTYSPDDEEFKESEEEEDDGWQEFKDGIAMGYHDKYGNPLDPPDPEPDDFGGQFPDEEWESEPAAAD